MVKRKLKLGILTWLLLSLPLLLAGCVNLGGSMDFGVIKLPTWFVTIAVVGFVMWYYFFRKK